jgi:hypothetical protein
LKECLLDLWYFGVKNMLISLVFSMWWIIVLCCWYLIGPDKYSCPVMVKYVFKLLCTCSGCMLQGMGIWDIFAYWCSSVNLHAFYSRNYVIRLHKIVYMSVNYICRFTVQYPLTPSTEWLWIYSDGPLKQ